MNKQYTKSELIGMIASDGDYWINFTLDTASDYFNREHRKMKKSELIEIFNRLKGAKPTFRNFVSKAENSLNEEAD